jgi:hypothetical protein
MSKRLEQNSDVIEEISPNDVMHKSDPDHYLLLGGLALESRVVVVLEHANLETLVQRADGRTVARGRWSRLASAGLKSSS